MPNSQISYKITSHQVSESGLSSGDYVRFMFKSKYISLENVYYRSQELEKPAGGTPRA